MSWQAAFQVVAPYIVKIQTPAGAGSGFFFAYNEDRSLVGVATALHVIDEANEWRQPLKVMHVQTNKELFLSYGERVILMDYRRDSAAILILTKAVADAGIPVPETMLEMVPSDKVMKIGVGLGWAGYPAIAPSTLCLFQGGVSAVNDANDSYYIDGIAINGVSGGPVFDDAINAPRIVGIVSAYHYNRQPGANLPGLLMAYDATHLNDTVEKLKTLDEARKKAAEVTKEQKDQERDSQSAAGPPEPETPRQQAKQPDPSADEPPRPVKPRPRQGGKKP